MQANMEDDRAVSQQCVQKAEQYRAAGNLEKALYFYEKANRIHSTPDLAARIKAVQNQMKGGKATAAPSASAEGKPAPRRASEQPHAPPKREENHNPVQVALVRKIKAAKNYYETLGVDKSADDSEIKKAYRKLALQVHPDKCTAPGAEDAFKSVTRAFQCLSDEQKRHDYDTHGHEDGAAAAYAENMRSRARSRQGGYNGDPWQGMSPEEMFFREFFGANVHRYNGPFGAFNVRTHQMPRRRQQGPRQEGQQQSESLFGNVLPLILLLQFLFLFSSFIFTSGGNEPVFALERTREFPIPRTTKLAKVPYYLKAGVDYSGGWEDLERQVLRTYRKDMEVKCHRERKEKEYLEQNANRYKKGTEQHGILMKKAKGYKLKSCDEWHRVTKLVNSEYRRR